jgi:hypothetical protein
MQLAWSRLATRRVEGKIACLLRDLAAASLLSGCAGTSAQRHRHVVVPSNRCGCRIIIQMVES